MERTPYIHAFGHRMAHLSAIFDMAGSSDMTRFGSLEFLALLPVGMWVPPIFEPSQTFLFGSLDFVADRLARAPPPRGGTHPGAHRRGILHRLWDTR